MLSSQPDRGGAAHGTDIRKSGAGMASANEKARRGGPCQPNKSLVHSVARWT